ncbi:MAG: sodium:proton exchanger [Candidatus Mcinerneyibacterium aminivorans]|uniref:Sodium:proton exchanger n=1 Tax=Candidatus Mcinerneyibacterium aminivorans TaxID=2703815 RepID=A0A5D0M9J3_9BACT|nr:MAG: sodium:proton exchanger [Candidatus Mcinerneyibacterium aminivorans]
MNNLLLLSLVLIVAIIAEKITSKFNLPTVTGYVVFGIIFGKSLVGLFGSDFLSSVSVINDIALGAIAFTIGAELKRKTFKRLGKSIFFIVFFEAIFTFIFVSTGMYLLHPDKFYQAIILGAVASATAPAATVMVLNQYNAKGPLTSTILAVVGIDDSIALIIFAFASTTAKSLLKGSSLTISRMLVSPMEEIFFSIILGVIMGLVFNHLFKNVRGPKKLVIRISAAILLLLGITTQFDLSELLTIMAFAATISNINSTFTTRSHKVIANISPVFYALFFILAGARLDITLLPVVGVMGLLYTLLRMGGKYSGATLGAILGNAPKVVKKYVGFGLIPQVGVALALAIIVNKTFGGGNYGDAGIMLAKVVINILLFTTIITEIVGPLLTGMAVKKAGEDNEN